MVIGLDVMGDPRETKARRSQVALDATFLGFAIATVAAFTAMTVAHPGCVRIALTAAIWVGLALMWQARRARRSG